MRVSASASACGTRSCRSRWRWLTARMVTVTPACSPSSDADAKPVMLLIIVYSRGPPAPLARRLPASSFQLPADRRLTIDDLLRCHAVFRALWLEHLHLVERGIDALPVQQILMLSDLHDAAALEHDDVV